MVVFVIPQFCFMIITVPYHFNIELMYYMCAHSKMEVDNFVMLQIGEKNQSFSAYNLVRQLNK